MPFDVVVVGGGPSGLSAAIRLKQLAEQKNQELSVCLVEKGSEVGGHILSGACIEPRALDELLPDWRKDESCPLKQKVVADKMRFLTETKDYPLPVVPSMHNHGNYIGSLGELCAWLGAKAEELGVEVYSGFAAREAVLSPTTGAMLGVATNDVGIGKDGSKTANFERGIELLGKQTILAEGCRGHVTQSLIDHFNLLQDKGVPCYGLGVKELWEIDPELHQPGLVSHTMGWPLYNTYGGSFMYHYGENLVALGIVVGLDYKNPYMRPYMELQRMKHHPYFRKYFENGKCLVYGARTLYEGGITSQKQLTFPGGLLVGDTAGTLNLPKIKGTHTAMKSGMLAADSVYNQIFEGKDPESVAAGLEASSYQTAFKDSWAHKELWKVRNIKEGFHRFGQVGGTIYAGLSEYILRGHEPWTWKNSKEDYDSCTSASQANPIDYPKPDGKISFDLLTNLTRASTNHNADQPAHLTINSWQEQKRAYKVTAGPESRFCPAGVYEFVENPESGAQDKLQINAQNCVHCKACDIKCKHVTWVTPEGGGGPAYMTM